MSKCKQCGMCCRTMVVPLNPRTDKDAFELLTMKSNYIRHTQYAGQYWVMLNSQCVHLEHDYQCGKYEGRPKVCREWPKKNLKLWKKLCPECGYCE